MLTTATNKKIGIDNGQSTFLTNKMLIRIDSGIKLGRRRSRRRESVKQAVAQLQRVSWSAVQVLVQLMADAKLPPTTRLNAAGKVLDLAIHAVEMEDMDARLAALEALYAPSKL